MSLKQGVVPHIFSCQPKRSKASNTCRPPRRIHQSTASHRSSQSGITVHPCHYHRLFTLSAILMNIFNGTLGPVDVAPSNVSQDFDFNDSIENPYIPEPTPHPFPLLPVDPTVDIEFEEIDANSTLQAENAILDLDSHQASPQATLPVKSWFTISSDEEYSSNDENLYDEDSDYEVSSSEEAGASLDVLLDDLQKLSLTRTRRIVEKYPLRYIGVPNGSIRVVSQLVETITLRSSSLTVQDMVHLVLQKIRLDDSFDRLSDDYGISKSQASRIFGNLVRHIGDLLSEFIIWPDCDKIREQLPMAFRARYSDVQCIIDAFEIQIEKPSDPLIQALTWSDYKKANTIKYLISITPDGLVNFVSEGFGGRISDLELVLASGFLDKLKQGMRVMADRGFKHIESLLISKGCELVRPPSVEQDEILSEDTTILAKQIASLRSHIERAIRRVREYAFVAPHACTNNKLVHYLDDVVRTVAGLINLQGPLICV